MSATLRTTYWAFGLAFSALLAAGSLNASAQTAAPAPRLRLRRRRL